MEDNIVKKFELHKKWVETIGKDLGKIVRDMQIDKGAEFIDETTGIKWDVKSFESYPIGANGVPIKNPRKGAFTVQQGLKKIQKEFKNGNCVIIDTRKLVPEHIEQLKKAIEEAGGFAILYIMDYKTNNDLTQKKDFKSFLAEVFKVVGLNTKKTKIIWASDYIHQNPQYFFKVLDVSQKIQISDMYTCIQIANIFEINFNQKRNIDIYQFGLDQSKINELIKVYASKTGLNVPIFLSFNQTIQFDKMNYHFLFLPTLNNIPLLLNNLDSHHIRFYKVLQQIQKHSHLLFLQLANNIPFLLNNLV